MKRVTVINLVLGVWLIIAPFVVGYSVLHTNAVTNDVVVGILLLASSAWLLSTATAEVGLSCFQVLCGVWVLFAPFMLDYQSLMNAMTNDVIVGILVLIVSVYDVWAVTNAPIKA